MTIIFLLIGVSLLVALSFLGAFLWAVRTGQYEDTYTPSVRVLFEEDEADLHEPVGPPEAALPGKLGRVVEKLI